MKRLKRQVGMGMMLVVLLGGISSLRAGAKDNLIVIKGSEFSVPGQSTLTAWVETDRWLGSVRADLAEVGHNSTPVLVEIPEEGEWYLWARTSTGGSGITQYQVVINREILTQAFGNFEFETSKWERCGPIKLTTGQHKLELNKIGSGAVWCKAIVLTQDSNFVPPALELLLLPPTLANPGFEEDKDSDGLPDGWRKRVVGGTPEFVWDSRVKRSGKRSLSIIHHDDIKDIGFWQQKIRLKPNTGYEFVAHVKGEDIVGDRGTRVQASFFDKDGNTTGGFGSSPLTGSFDWKRVTHEFTTPPGTVAGRFELVFFRAAGQAWFEDVSLRELGYRPYQPEVIAPPLPILPVEMTWLTTARPTFRWNNRWDVATFTLEIAPDRDFHKEVLKIEGIKPSREYVLDEAAHWAITYTEYTLPPGQELDYGRWYWRVSHLRNDGQRSLFSAVRSFNISREDKDRLAFPENLEHPFLFFTRDDIPGIKARIESSPMLQRAWRSILGTATAMAKHSEPIPNIEALDKPIPGVSRRRFLSLARQMRPKLENLGFAYIITGDTKFARVARDRMLELAELERWHGPDFINPEIFSPPWPSSLATGEMSKAVATAYDWIYSFLTPEERKTIREALVELGVKPLRSWFDPDFSSRIPRHQVPLGNWTTVTSGGAGVAALVLVREVPEARKWVRQVRDNLRWWFNYEGGDFWIDGFDMRGPVKPIMGPVGIPFGPEAKGTDPIFGIDGGYIEASSAFH